MELEFIYILIGGNEWEDIRVYLSKQDAIIASINHPNNRVEIFSKQNRSGYEPTYNYYKNGEFIETR